MATTATQKKDLYHLAFEEYHDANPQVYEIFKQLAQILQRHNVKGASHRFVLHFMRSAVNAIPTAAIYEMAQYLSRINPEQLGAVRDAHSKDMAMLFVQEHPEARGLFVFTRESLAEIANDSVPPDEKLLHSWAARMGVSISKLREVRDAVYGDDWRDTINQKRFSSDEVRRNLVAFLEQHDALQSGQEAENEEPQPSLL